METNTNAYLDEIKRRQEALYQSKNKADELAFAKQQKEADAQRREAGRTASVRFQQSVNPYGVKREALAQRGLGSSGVEEIGLASSYNAYQNELDAARQARAKVQKNLVQALMQARRENSDELAKAAMEDAKARLENLAREREWEYQLARDKKADEEKEAELAKKRRALLSNGETVILPQKRGKV